MLHHNIVLERITAIRIRNRNPNLPRRLLRPRARHPPSHRLPDLLTLALPAAEARVPLRQPRLGLRGLPPPPPGAGGWVWVLGGVEGIRGERGARRVVQGGRVRGHAPAREEVDVW